MRRLSEKMPEEYKLETTKKSNITLTQPRRWSEEEINWMLKKKESGYSTLELADSMDRSEVSVSIKLKRLLKKNGNYNKKHVLEKYEVNREFIEIINPKSVLDVYCGTTSFYKKNFSDIKVTTNDKDIEIDADYHLDSLRFICLMYNENKKFDVVDLDPFGSAYECFDLAIKMAKKGIVITLGEMGHKRFKRLDFVRRMYGINSLDDFSSDNIIKEIINIGKKNKKKLTPIFHKDWSGISRVWFKIETMKITEQWE